MSDAPQVFQAISAVQADLSKVGISKDQYNAGQKFKFRGIDDVLNALSPLLAKHGLVIIPRVLSRVETAKATRSGGSMASVILECEFDFYAASDGSKVTCRTYGEALDSGDKGSNKSLTAAYKYACFQIFCIPIEGSPDADSDSHELAKPDPNQRVNELQGQQLKAALEASRSDVRAFLGYFKIDSVESMLASDFERASGMLKKKMAEMPENLL